MKLLIRKPTAMKVTATGTLLRALLLVLLVGPAMTTPTHAAGIPVIDTANLSQTVISSIEAVAQTLKQIQQYQTQLQQYENMLKIEDKGTREQFASACARRGPGFKPSPKKEW